MGRWAERYTREQKTAVGSAMLDPDPLTTKPLTAKQAVKRLNAGQLGVPAPAQPMPYTTAYDCRNQERRRRAGHELSPAAKQALEAPAETRNTIVQRLLTLHEYELAKLEQQRAQGKELDPRLYGTVVKNTPIVLSLLRPLKANGKPQPTQEPERPTAQDPSPTTELLRAHRETARPATRPIETALAHQHPDDAATDSGAGEHTHVGLATQGKPSVLTSS